jgi:hypothetical protein
VETEAWFAELCAQLPRCAPERLEMSDEERDALLDLARVAAHTSERWVAPVTTYLVGLAHAAMPPEERPAAVRTLVAALDPEVS